MTSSSFHLQEIQHFLRDLSAHNHQSFDCFVLAILSHGIEGAIYGVDERVVKIEHITTYFEGRQCPTLAGKPKLFFLQACRGGNVCTQDSTFDLIYSHFDGFIVCSKGIIEPFRNHGFGLCSG